MLSNTDYRPRAGRRRGWRRRGGRGDGPRLAMLYYQIQMDNVCERTARLLYMLLQSLTQTALRRSKFLP
ncbi:hypothetical protein CW304_27290 [Bacillus sp. UFRGS-B20]|nr:hypothetical protein CW304_27290 [Bacillus sp. UFRGS-B20]